MPTRDVSPNKGLEKIISGKVQRGEQQYQVKLTALRAAIDVGDASGLVRGDAIAQIRKELSSRLASARAAPSRFSKNLFFVKTPAKPRPES